MGGSQGSTVLGWVFQGASPSNRLYIYKCTYATTLHLQTNSTL